MTRLPDWPERLHAFIESRARTAFAWGSNDCCLFAADAVLAMTGKDLVPADPFSNSRSLRGAYSTEVQAMRLLKNRYTNLPGLVSKAGLTERENIKLCRRGDVALVRCEDRQCLAVCLGEYFAAPGKEGAVYLPLASVERAWVVG